MSSPFPPVSSSRVSSVMVSPGFSLMSSVFWFFMGLSPLQKEKGRAGARPLRYSMVRPLSVELLDDCLDRVDDAFLVDLEALLLQEVEDVLLLLLAAALSDVELLSGSDADLYPRGQLLALCLGGLLLQPRDQENADAGADQGEGCVDDRG